MNAPSAAQIEIGFGPKPTDPSPLDLRFQTFHNEHPEVFVALRDLARKRVAYQRRVGRSVYVGAKALIERLRAGPDDETDDTPWIPFIDNTFASRYARLLEAECPDLRGCFQLKELNS